MNKVDFSTCLIVLASLAVLPVSAATSYDNGTYVVTAPYVLRPGIPATITVNILRSSSVVAVIAKIVSKSNQVVSEGNANFNAGSPGSMVVQVPSNVQAGEYSLLIEGSGGLTFKKNDTVRVSSKTTSIFIQTDKAIYKAGQAGVLVKDYPLSTEPPLGQWTLRVITKHGKQEKNFKVDEYVLPRFKTDVVLPSYALSTDDKLPISITAKYTYGMPVKGKAHIQLTTQYWYGSKKRPEIWKNEDIDGELKISIPLVDIKWHLNKNRDLHYFYLLVNVTVVEGLTGIGQNGSARITFYKTPYRVKVVSSSSAYKPGLPYHALLAVVQPDGKLSAKPLKDYLTVTTYNVYSKPYVIKYVADDGFYKLTWNLPSNATNFYYTAYYGTKNKDSFSTYGGASLWSSKNKDYIQLTNRTSSFHVGKIAIFDVLSSTILSGKSLTFEVISRGAIVHSGSLTMTGSKASFTFSVAQVMVPKAWLLVYYVGTGYEIIGDSYQFEVVGLFENKVSVNFDKSTQQPGLDINLKVKASPNSRVGVLAVDQSVLLMQTGNDFSVQEVKKEIGSYDGMNYYPHYPIDIMFKRSIAPGGFYFANNMRGAFKRAGLVVLTNSLLSGYDYDFPVMEDAMDMLAGNANSKVPSKQNNAAGEVQVVQAGYVRTFFPETWLWVDKNASSSGDVSINTKMPDTITSWVASAFAVSSLTGFGVAPTHGKVRGFQSFFVSLNLPYSVIRGEHMALQAVVFNYLNTDVLVSLVLEGSNDWQNIDIANSKVLGSGSKQLHLNIKAGQAATAYFPIVPTKIGTLPISVKAQSSVAADAVIRQLRVEPEGIEQEYTENYLVDIHNSKATHSFRLSLPPHMVDGSASAKLNVIGDLMGPTISNLDKLLQMPYGCGEQNMLNFAPDIYISKYLTVTHQLTADVKEKALRYMVKGYQKELTYRRSTGSYSAFGNQDPSGSMWLTAFVVKCFSQAKPYIYIDPNATLPSVNWIINKQNKDGTFQEPGRVIHKAMKGGVTNDVTLAAFVLIALQESNVFSKDVTNAKTKAMQYLENKVNAISSPYTMAIVTYALTLTHSKEAGNAFDKLKRMSVQKDGATYWIAEKDTPRISGRWYPPYSRSDSLNIEATSYALLCYVLNGDKVGAAPIAKWLSLQRNSYGGFSSTQDTCMALEALAKFAATIYGADLNADIYVRSTNNVTFFKHFTVSKANAAVLQQADVPITAGNLTLEANGTGLGLIQLGVKYHVDKDPLDQSFEVEATILTHSNTEIIYVQACGRWKSTGASGMSIIEVGIPSGFNANENKLRELVKQNTLKLKRHEMPGNRIVLYFDELTKDKKCVTLMMEHVVPVAMLKPVPVRVYDYYQPHKQATTFYKVEKLSNSNLCTVCAHCIGCTSGSAKSSYNIVLITLLTLLIANLI